MKLAVLLVSRNRPDLVQAMVDQLAAKLTIDYDLFLVECGTELDKLTPHTAAWYPDPDFRGKCYGHNVALQLAQLKGRYDYYWVLMNDLVFEGPEDPARTLIETLEREERMAILSPCDLDGPYPASRQVPGGDWRAVTTCDYLGFMYKGAALEECGFLKPEFKYCWGAIHDLSFRLHSAGWFLAYSDRTVYRHLGGTTYGAKNTQTISREAYQENAKRFAYDYFRERHGDDWDQTFWKAAERFKPAFNTYAEHKRYWGSVFSPEELAARQAADGLPGASAVEAPGLVKLHLGCGKDKRPGWVNVDVQPAVHPDVVSNADDLPMFPDASVDVIEANHLFEHLTRTQAGRALKEWARVLKPGGSLYLELPDLEACIRMLGRYRDAHGIDLGMVGIYGWPVDIDAEGVPQMHKWGWTRQSLTDELRSVGFSSVEFGPITQQDRPAARYGRDMRLCARRACASRQPDPALPRQSAVPPQLFAWPDWRSPAELDLLMDGFARPLLAHAGGQLVLHHDARHDPPRDLALAALDAAYQRVLPGCELNVLLLENTEGDSDWSRLGRDLDAVASLPSAQMEPRRTAAAALGLPLTDRNTWQRQMRSHQVTA